MLGGMPLPWTDEGGGDVITKLYKTNEVDLEGIEITEKKQFHSFTA